MSEQPASQPTSPKNKAEFQGPADRIRDGVCVYLFRHIPYRNAGPHRLDFGDGLGTSRNCTNLGFGVAGPAVWDDPDDSETAGTIVMAYILTRPMKFIQIPLAALTPPIAKIWRRRNTPPTSESAE